ncbi:PAS domain-containing sensor histidine kinase [Pelosinus propionicus]|uniref:histidine kinase n=1 Tax=Pelosinus propionicus DSM 13327 TaxID=1123291 RepID=A0A1I4H0T0_9FIRM|nr:PAS domain-containing sensor histidine kinase [Pelosinus propionicus]SFL35864.1 PAS domain S-box-containing protein [Pelosinus propionicus DSM 13327]
MDFAHLSAIGSLIGTISIVFVYFYLYALYRERYIGVWATSWIILLSRYVLFDSGILLWKQTFFGLLIYQMLIIISTLLYVSGIYNFMNKPMNKWWLYGTAGISILIIFFNLLFSSLAYKLLLPLFYGSFTGIWIGVIFIRYFKHQGLGGLITGYAFILWSLLSLTMPFTITIPWFAPWGYVFGGILRLAIAIGTLMVYFVKTRTDLITKETQYRLLAENAIDIIYSYQLFPERKVEYISPSVLRVTGYSAEDYYENDALILKLIHPDDLTLLTDFVKNLPFSIEVPLTLRLILKNKTILWVEQKCVPIYEENGRLTALQGIVRDITVRKKLEHMSSLFDRMNLVGSMAAAVAHEIRNPMTTVRGYLQVMARKHEYQEDNDKFKLMIEEIDRANSIIREYLSLSREKLVVLKQCSLNGIIEALFPLLQADANSSKVSIKLNLNTITELMLDENEIRQLLLNLVRNSIEAMPLGGALTISTSLENSKVILAISDQGEGIPSHVLDKLGTPFITTKDTGTGLGLPICYQIAHRHKATIRISTSQEGTTFFIYFTPQIS